MASAPEGSSAVTEAPVSPPDPGLLAVDEESSPPSSVAPGQLPRLPSLRSTSDSPAVPPMAFSSNPLGSLAAARRPAPPQSSVSAVRPGALPQDMQAKMKAFHLSRQGAPPATQKLRLPSGSTPLSIPSNVLGGPGAAAAVAGHEVGQDAVVTSPVGPGGPLVAGMSPLRLAPQGRPLAPSWSSAPVLPGPTRARAPKPSLGARRGLNLPGGLPGALSNAQPTLGNVDSSRPVKRDFADPANVQDGQGAEVACAANKMDGVEAGSLFNRFSEFVDTKAGTLKFAGKAVIHGKGVDFSSGSSFSISLDEVDNLEELGKGNYGTVYKVRHSRPQMRRPGMGLKGNRRHPSLSVPATPSALPSRDATDPPGLTGEPETTDSETAQPASVGDTTGVIMAMKEIRLELDEAKFAAIIMELDILHRCISPFIVDFYGAFFQEGAVYICLEYMDGGSIDKLYGDGIPESVLRKITLSVVMGLKTLKDEHNIIHRDVKPTNVLVNTKGQVKICDFGVSGNLVASIAKTNIGCQSYMAPERIASGGVAQAGANPGGGTYSVQSDIWSLGLTVIECAMGRYPYAPETYNNIFSQLSVRLNKTYPGSLSLSPESC